MSAYVQFRVAVGHCTRAFCIWVILWTSLTFPQDSFAKEDEDMPSLGRPTVGLIAGPMHSIRLSDAHTSKLSGGATVWSWTKGLGGPIGSDWYRGQVLFGAEAWGFSTSEPIGAYGVGLTPKLTYVFTSLGRFRPFVEGGGGGVWTDLGGRVPEQAGQLNFLAWGGGGFSWAMTNKWAVNAGYRFAHISNADTRKPNNGLNFGLPYVGVTYRLF
jgi:hypothetical protein